MDGTTDQKKTKVLVVDDEALIAHTLKAILNGAGYEAVSASSGEAAMEILRDFTPDILIADIIMPGMSGIDLATEVQAQLPACKVLLVSGAIAAAALLDAARTRHHEFEVLAKPIPPEELMARMRGAIGTA